jgi:hypothetical protein
MLMVIFMKDSGSMIKLMDMELTSMQMEQLMLVNGLKISSMEKELKSGQMVLSMKAIIKMGRNMGTAV